MIRAEDKRKKRGIYILCVNIIWIINHLGTNPVKGGSPPKESRLRGTLNVGKSDVWLLLSKSEIEFDWKEWNRNTTEEEIKA